ncbi:prolyl oligopeptidase family serine peptidase [Spirosoma sp. BT702]|uniref:Prolyl oligopeptidase family serine peptidase n=1 Tax=Spirosoma profusum TaxID=2771354 RepID=A0A927AR55_9BACT|nr:alpha/beta hydrolase-fold protein [Spirosoma profusum]MBD2701818.1 prolyl oligopeptidase family serine peptidase [Spirosoma profusum]
MKQILFLLFLGVLAYPTQAQSVYSFSAGLGIGPCHHYGREALYTDQLAYLLYQNKLQTPTEGRPLSENSPKDVTWQAISTDKDRKFRGRSFNNGYLYLTYDANREQAAILHITGHNMVYVNGAPHAGDPYASGWLHIPISLKKGRNEFYVRTSAFSRYQGLMAELIFPEKPVSLNIDDPTLPNVVLGNQAEPLWGAIVVVNTTSKPLIGLQIQSQLAGNNLVTNVPTVPPLTTRKVGFQINVAGVQQKGDIKAQLRLLQSTKPLDEKEISLSVVDPLGHQDHTFISQLDGSVQYYGVAPQQKPDGNAPALFLSVHGAGVEAGGQARAYQPKDWGVLVAPTNRRPRGFNWEDWGRLDALEVFDIAKKRYKPDPQRIYLTGHSMGGHGTWYLGATLPGNWAAIAPCAGYPTLADYGSHDGKIPTQGGSTVENILLRASNPSNVVKLANNYKPLGIYVLHGDADLTVSVEYARQMRKLLGTFHPDFSYYEYPGGSHWYGSESVDWKPLFDYFQAHRIQADSAANSIDFTTSNPAISSTIRWVGIEQQQQPLQLSRVQLKRNKKAKTITGKTENISLLTVGLHDFQPGETVTITLDSTKSISHTVKGSADKLYLARKNGWEVGTKPALTQKGPHRSGTFKEPFANRMVFVYGTSGTADENNWAYNKARYDAETWYYRGNGAVDMVTDKEFLAGQYVDRGVILYGNSTTNRAWSKLLANCPIQASRDVLTIGSDRHMGSNIGAYFVWPRPDSPTASVAVITGTGLTGLKATDANQYFAGGSGFPDFMIFDVSMLQDGVKGIRQAGFFDNNWALSNEQTASQTTVP